VRQFFPSIDHGILRRTLARTIGPAGCGSSDVMWLVDRILESGTGVLSEEYSMVYFPGDDLLAATRPRGLPIGNLTSQFWANCFLSPFDHFVKRELRCPGYVRFVDDLLLFGDNKAQLWAWKEAVVERLAGIRLTIHEARAQVWPTTEGMPFLGFVVYPHKRRLKARNAVAYARRFRILVGEYAAGRLSLERLTASARGWANHAQYGDTWGLRRDVLGSVALPAVQGGEH
jgi:hypothetical protein